MQLPKPSYTRTGDARSAHDQVFLVAPCKRHRRHRQRHFERLQRVGSHHIEGRGIHKAHKVRFYLLPVVHAGVDGAHRQALGLGVVADAPRVFPERHGADVKLLDLVHRSDGDVTFCCQRQAVREGFRVERAHDGNVSQVDVGE